MKLYKEIPYLLHWLWSTGFNIVSKVFPSFFASVASASQISIIYSLYASAKFLVIPCGWISDSLGKGKTLFYVFFALPIIALMFTISDSILFFTLMYFIVGILSNFYYASISSIITILHKEKTKALFRLESLYQLGAFMGPIIGGALVLKNGGLQMAFYVWAALGLIGLLFSFFLKKENAVQKEDRKRPSFRKLLRELGSNRWNFLAYLVIGSFLTGFFESVITLAVPLYLTFINFDISVIGLIIGCGSIVSIIGLLVLGKFMDRMGHKKSLVFTSLLVAISTIFFITTKNIFFLIALIGLFTIGRAGGLNITKSFISSNIAEELRATGMSINDTFQYLARVIGPLIAGLLIDFNGNYAPFIMCFFLASIAAIAMLFKDKVFKLFNQLT
ncbi:MAG: MFS transporter [Candidatus Paceibacterota bacterium]|jgi:DHA1 family quinolone resistance protein-like MFS transporter